MPPRAANDRSTIDRVAFIHPECESPGVGCSADALRGALEHLPPGLRCPGVEVGADDDWRAAVRVLAASAPQAVSLHHAFATFPAERVDALGAMLDMFDAPLVVTLHDVLTHPTPEERGVVRMLAGRAAAVVVKAEKAAQILSDTYGVGEGQSQVIPVGVRPLSPAHMGVARRRLGVEGRRVLMTAGLLCPDMGVEVVIEALPRLVEREPDLVYVVVGETLPRLVAREGERYREHLVEMARELGVEAHFRLTGRLATGDALDEALAAADIYVSPYLSEATVSSDTLASAVGAGAAVVATPFWHAQELLGDGAGLLVPFGAPGALAEVVETLLASPEALASQRARALEAGRAIQWPRIARRYAELFQAVATPGAAPERTAAVEAVVPRAG